MAALLHHYRLDTSWAPAKGGIKDAVVVTLWCLYSDIVDVFLNAAFCETFRSVTSCAVCDHSSYWCVKKDKDGKNPACRHFLSNSLY